MLKHILKAVDICSKRETTDEIYQKTLRDFVV